MYFVSLAVYMHMGHSTRGNKLDTLDENQRSVLAHAKVNSQRPDDSRANLHLQTGKTISRFVESKRIALQAMNDSTKG